jgi:amidohydrolase
VEVIDMFGVDDRYLIETRRHLHAHPELSLHEYETAAYIEAQLDAFGIEHRRVGETGVLGFLRGGRGAGKTLLLRADIDALPVSEETGAAYRSQNPGVMHACGHDAHTAALLGAAKALQANKDTFGGLVLLVFQQAEEFGHGSRFFEGLGICVDRAFAVHVSPHLPVSHIGITNGAAAAACDYFRIAIRGKGAHITRPEQGVDALAIACALVPEITALAESAEGSLIGIGKLAAGNTYNVIADKAVIEGSVRSFSDKTQARLKAKIVEMTQRLAEAKGAAATVAFETFTPALVNDAEAIGEFLAVAAETLGMENIHVSDQPGMGYAGDDFAVFLQNIKGVYAMVGTANGDSPNTMRELHDSQFDLDERALSIAARLHIAYTLSILQEK